MENTQSATRMCRVKVHDTAVTVFLRVAGVLAGLCFLLLSACSVQFRTEDGMLLPPVVSVAQMSLVYLNDEVPKEFVFAADRYAEAGADFGSGTKPVPYTGYVRTEKAFQLSALTQKIAVYGISDVFYVRLTRSVIRDTGTGLERVEYSRFDTLPYKDYPAGKFLFGVFSERGYAADLKCPLTAYDPDLMNKISACEDGVYIFLHPIMLQAGGEQTSILNTADVLIQQKGAVSPVRLIYTYPVSDLNKVPMAQNERSFGVHLLAYLQYKTGDGKL